MLFYIICDLILISNIKYKLKFGNLVVSSSVMVRHHWSAIITEFARKVTRYHTKAVSLHVWILFYFAE